MDEVLSIGVILDDTVSWKQQVNYVTKKDNRVLYSLKFIRSCTSQLLRRRLVESLLIPYLDYCKGVYADMSLELRKKLQRLGNSGITYIFGIRRDEHITPYRRKLKWLSNDTRRNFFAMLIMYRLVRMNKPPLLLPLFKLYHSDKPTKGPRNDLEITTMLTDSGKNSFQNKYANLWNSLPPSYRELPPFSRFKKSIKLYFSNLDN